MNNKIASISQQVLLAVIFFTLLSGGCSVWLSSQKPLSPEQTHLLEICNNTWKMGINVIFGLSGCNAVGLLRSVNEEE